MCVRRGVYTHSVSHAHFSDTFSLRGVQTSRTRTARGVLQCAVSSPLHLTFLSSHDSSTRLCCSRTAISTPRSRLHCPCRVVPDPKARVKRTSARAAGSLAKWPIPRTPQGDDCRDWYVDWKKQIKCPATPITYAFIYFNDSDARNKYVRSANMSRKELRGRKYNYPSQWMQRKDFSPQKKGGVQQMLHSHEAWHFPSHRSRWTDSQKHVSVDGQIVVRTCESGSLKYQDIEPEVEEYMENWLAKKSSQRLWAVVKWAYNAEKGRLWVVKRPTETHNDQRDDKRTGNGGVRQKLKHVDGDFPCCMRRISEDNEAKTIEHEKSIGKGGNRQKLRHVDWDVPLGMRSKGEDQKRTAAAKKRLKSAAWKKDSRSKAACGSNDLCGVENNEGEQRKCQHRTKRRYFSLCYNTMRSMDSSERIEGMIRELEGYRWDAVLLNETWRPAKSEMWETHQRHIFTGSGKYENKHRVGILLNKKWRKRIKDTGYINERAITTQITVNHHRIKLMSEYFLHSEYAEHHVEQTNCGRRFQRRIGPRLWSRTSQCWSAHTQRGDTEIRSTQHDVQKNDWKANNPQFAKRDRETNWLHIDQGKTLEIQ